MFIKDSSGNKSLTATLALAGFIVVMVKLLLSGASVTMGSASYEFGTIDAAMIAAVLTPVLGTYTARRWGQPAPSEIVEDTADTGSADERGGMR